MAVVELLSPPEVGQMVKVRGGMYIVTDVKASEKKLETSGSITPDYHVVDLTSLMDDALGEELSVIWQIEAGARVFENIELPEGKGFDEPKKMEAFLNAVRWGASSNADRALIQAPFRCGVSREPYQLDPLVRAVSMPRVNLLIADDVGLGKTIETGLVLQEMIFRHRVHTALIVCPASLQVQWQEQMRDKFGLEFHIVDSELVRTLRRKRGIRSNPWSHFPRLITSIDYLKRDKSLQAIRELLPPGGEPTFPRRIDMLIVDEAHIVAPSSTGKYAIDSKRTRAIRMIAPHSEHKLFLTATPHNGYLESFTALLELLDNQRFTRGIKPTSEQLKAIMIRRLKTDLKDEIDGEAIFPERLLKEILVDYTDEEKEIHHSLNEYARLRKQRMTSQQGKYLIEFIYLLIKKRLFSSPQAFLNTVETHIETLKKKPETKTKRKMPSVSFLKQEFEAIEEGEFANDSEYLALMDEQIENATSLFDQLSEEELNILEKMKTWGTRASAAGDSKSKHLINWLKKNIRPGGKWSDERVIIFTEYKDTLYWLMGLLEREGFFKKDRVMVIEGGMDSRKREEIKAAFQARPQDSKVRILLATDAASEGIDLQNHCHRLIHYEVPWNPNRMEQRNGRIDRHGQRFRPEIYNFVAAGYESSSQQAGTLEADLDLFRRLVYKVENIREDLGKVGPVLSRQFVACMTGERQDFNTSVAEDEAKPTKAMLKVEENIKDKIRELAAKLRDSEKQLQISPETIKSVVECGLELAGQPTLIETKLEGVWPDNKGRYKQCPIYKLPDLNRQWVRCKEGLTHPHTRQERPITFEPSVIKGRDDVVLVHLNHRLVQMCLRLLRAEVWSQDAKLNRMSACLVPDNELEAPAIMAFARLVVIGGNKERLHEEIIMAGGYLREGRFNQIPTETEKYKLLEHAIQVLPGEGRQERLISAWDKHKKAVARALQSRQNSRLKGGLLGTIESKCKRDIKDVEAIMDELKKSIEEQLNQGPQQLMIQFEELNLDEQEQLNVDISNLKRRLERIPIEKKQEVKAIEQRYSNPQARLFPVGVMWFVPETKA